MRRVAGAVVAAVMVMAAAGAMVGEEHMHPAPPASAALERIKALAGRWEGAAQMENGETAPTVIEYQVTSGGSAVVETMDPGTPHEMVSVYHDEGGTLVMTHYCMLGNQPVLKLTADEPQQITLSLDGARGIGSAQEMHMHGLSLTWADPDHLTQTWTSYNEGQPTGNAVFTIARARRE